MKDRLHRIGYVSIEVVITAAIILVAGFGGLMTFGGTGAKTMMNGLAKLDATGVWDAIVNPGGGEAAAGAVDANGYPKSLNISLGDVNPLSDFTFEADVDNDGWRVVSYLNSSDMDVIIPKFYSDGKPITSIADWAFTWHYENLTSIVLPDSIVSIGYGAFSGSSISSVILPSSLRVIGESAFDGNSLTSLVIPNGVTTIGPSAFAYNQIADLTLPSSVTNIGNGAFNFNSLPLDQALIYRNPNSPTELVSYGAPYDWHDVVIPSGVITIADNAFANASLTSITIPDTVVTIGDGAFMGVNLESLSLTLPDSVVNLGPNAFRLSNIKTIYLSNSITQIQTGTFYQANATSIVLPANVNAIGSQAFYGMASLASVIIPATVTNIGNEAFKSCSKLASVTFLGVLPPTLGVSIFGTTPLLTTGTIDVPDSQLTAYRAKALSNFGKTSTTFK